MSTPNTELLSIDFTIPLNENQWDLTSVVFHEWLPAGKTEALHRKKGNFSAILWIDRDCLPTYVPEEEIPRYQNIDVNRLKIEVEVREVPIELSNFVYDERESGKGIHHGLKPNDPRYDEFRTKYHQLARDVLSFTVEMHNRFVEYVRIEKAQFWLKRRQFNEGLLSSFHVASRAKAKCGDRDLILWATNFPIKLTVAIGATDPYVKRSEWQKIQQHVGGSSRTNPVSEFVSNAMFFAAVDTFGAL